MTPRGRAPAAAVILAVTACAGCLTARGPIEVRDALRERYGFVPEREFGLRAGFLTTKLALGVARLASDEPIPGLGISGFEVATYRMPAADPTHRGGIRDLKIRGWAPVVRVRDRDGEAVILVREGGSSFRGLLVVSADPADDEIVVVRLRGRLERMLQGAVREAMGGAGSEAIARAGSPAAGFERAARLE